MTPEEERAEVQRYLANHGFEVLVGVTQLGSAPHLLLHRSQLIKRIQVPEGLYRDRELHNMWVAFGQAAKQWMEPRSKSFRTPFSEHVRVIKREDGTFGLDLPCIFTWLTAKELGELVTEGALALGVQHLDLQKALPFPVESTMDLSKWPDEVDSGDAG